MPLNTSYVGATDDLKAALGKLVFTDSDTLYKYSFDALRISFLPQAVVKIKKSDEVGFVLKLANRYRVPVTCRGTGSCMTGAATPVNGGWVMDVSGLDHLKIDVQQRVAFAQAGVITGRLKEKAAAVGLFYPPDPGSVEYCTIGGNIACNAGGMNGLKYGVTRDYVMALKGFLPTGEYVEWARPLRKFASGFNVRDLWVGSQGMLGVVTEAALKLIPQPEQRKLALAGFPGNSEAARAAESLLTQGELPSALEFLGEWTVRALREEGSLPEEFQGTTLILVEFDGHQEDIDRGIAQLTAWARRHEVPFKVAESAEESKKLWKIRRHCSAAMFRYGDTKLNEDLIVPLDRIATFLDYIKKLSEKMGLRVPVFGHLGDGNLHVNLMFNSGNKDQEEKAEIALEGIMKKAVDLGGAITAEHGIGMSKSAFIQLQHTKTEIDAMKRIKKALDPNDILNPGKMFQPFNPWRHKTEAVKFPWDLL